MKPEKIATQPADEIDIAALLKGRKPRRKLSRIVWGVALAAAVAGAAWYFLAGSGNGTAVTYVTQPAARGDITVTVTATGTVEPTNQVELSSELSGTIGSVSADFNDVIRKGQALAMLKTDQLEANVELARATLAARTAEVQQAEATVAERDAALARAKELLARSISSTESFETAKANSDRAVAGQAAAEANLDIAAANLKIAESNLAKACICSPIDGVVLARNVEVGQTVASSLSAPVLFTLAEDLASMQLQVDIDEADMGAVHEGESATFTVEAFPGRRFPATITQVRLSPETIEGVVTYKAILAVDNADLLLRPGMTATAEIVVEAVKDALLVPNAALRYTPPQTATSGSRGSGLLGLLIPRPPGGSTSTGTVEADGRRTIWVLRDGAPVAVHVVTGASDGSRTAVLSGEIAAGDAVIIGTRSGTSP